MDGLGSREAIRAHATNGGRLEAYSGIPPSRTQTLVDLRRVFEAAGIEFIGTPEEGPGVRLWRRGDK